MMLIFMAMPPVLNFLKNPIAKISVGLILTLGICLGMPQESEKVGVEAPFSHTVHVSSSWIFNKEKSRDCKGCHDYSAQKDPTVDTCKKCHYLEEHKVIRAAKGFEKGLEALRDKKSSFRHEYHLNFECKSCHNPAVQTFGEDPKNLQDIVIPKDMPIPRGSGVCLKCHDPKGSRPFPNAVLPATVTRHLNRLNQSPSMGASGFSGFRHIDHMKVEDLNNPQSCRSCHESVVSSDIWSLAKQEYSSDTCGKCHIQSQQKEPLEYITKEIEKLSPTGGCFSHQDHLNPEALQKDPQLRAQLCMACHSYSEKEETFALKPQFGKYEGCIQCHSHKEWAVEDHGEVDDCRSCHTVGRGSMKENRPRVTVTRKRPTGFKITSQAHPLITGNKRPTGECGKCHVAQIKELPSRIGTKKFDHKTHLPKNPKAEDCNTCHQKTLSKAGSGKDLQLSYDLEACKTCHKGVSKIEETFPDKILPKSVVSFSHQDHLKSGIGLQGETYDCLTCHEANTEKSNVDVGVKESALKCSTCHNHKENSKITAGRDLAYVTSCTQCHKSGVPKKGEEVFVQRQEIVSVKGTQFHPLNTDCNTCHFLPFNQVSRIERKHENHFFATLKTDEPYHFIQTDGYRAPNPDDNCLCCHWGQQVRRDRRPPNLKGARIQRIRDLLGEALGAYPGKECSQP